MDEQITILNSKEILAAGGVPPNPDFDVFNSAGKQGWRSLAEMMVNEVQTSLLFTIHVGEHTSFDTQT